MYMLSGGVYVGDCFSESVFAICPLLFPTPSLILHSCRKVCTDATKTVSFNLRSTAGRDFVVARLLQSKCVCTHHICNCRSVRKKILIVMYWSSSQKDSVLDGLTLPDLLVSAYDSLKH